MDQNFGIKELYEACFKATYQMKIGNTTYEPGEPVLFFENISLARVDNPIVPIIAKGGKGNPPLVYWEDEKEKMFSMENGLLSKTSFSILSNANALITAQKVIVPKNQHITTLADGTAKLFATPYSSSPVFIYQVGDYGTKTKITDYTITDDVVTTTLSSADLFVSYYYEETGQTAYELGLNKLNTFFNFEGKMYYRDEKEGIDKTCVLVIPRLKIMSNLTLTVGEKANPVVANFNSMVFPLMEQGKNVSMKFYFLNRDIDYDI